MTAGLPFGLKPGHTSTIRRIEGGMLSYHADADIDTNPYELGLGPAGQPGHGGGFHRQVRAAAHPRCRGRPQAGRPDHRGRAAQGAEHAFLAGHHQGAFVGKVTSAVYSPRLQQNIALAMVCRACAELGTEFEVFAHSGQMTPRDGGAKAVLRPQETARRGLKVQEPCEVAQKNATAKIHGRVLSCQCCAWISGPLGAQALLGPVARQG